VKEEKIRTTDLILYFQRCTDRIELIRFCNTRRWWV